MRHDFEVGANLLRGRGVPFDPNLLLENRWPETLATMFAQMSEMQETRYVAGPIQGVEMADILYMPEKVRVTGDLVILANHLVFEGTDVLIKGNYNVAIFPAEKVTIMGDLLPRRSHKEGGNAG